MKLNVALIQTDQVWEDIDSNLATAARLIENSEGSLAVLPEMFATGFSMNAESIAETPEGKVFSWMKETSNRTGKAIVGSFAAKEEVHGRYRYYNRLVFMKPDGEYAQYDKRHLFRLSGEHNVYQPGKKRIIVEWQGVRILPIICYDLRFPVWLRNRGDYDLLINVASWAEARRDVWLTLLKARAIENISYVVGVNRVGDDPDAHYKGDSIAYDFRGRIIAEADADREQSVTAAIDLDALAEFRKKFPAHLDADDFDVTL